MNAKLECNVDTNDFLDIAKEILDNEGLIDINTGKLLKPEKRTISLAKMTDPDKKEFIAVAIYAGTKEEIEEMNRAK